MLKNIVFYVQKNIFVTSVCWIHSSLGTGFIIVKYILFPH